MEEKQPVYARVYVFDGPGMNPLNRPRVTIMDIQVHLLTGLGTDVCQFTGSRSTVYLICVTAGAAGTVVM
jgi:hypothetical protein